VCDSYGAVTVAGTVESGDLVETSGIAASRLAPGVLWAHNDSGDDARLYAVGPGGEDLGAVAIADGLAFDWEDLASGPGPDAGRPYLYIGDIGDNLGIRRGRVTVYRVPEPDPTAAIDSVPVEAIFVLDSPDGAQNFEALFVADGSIYLATKDRQTTRIYQSAPLTEDGGGLLTLIATLDLGAEVTAADISWDGSTIAFRGYDTVWMWHREANMTIADALATAPCTVASPHEEQGEALAFLGDGSMVTVSEGSNPELNVVPRDS